MMHKAEGLLQLSTNVTSFHSAASGCLKARVTLELCHLPSVASMGKLNTGSMAITTFVDKTLRKWCDSPPPHNGHWFDRKQVTRLLRERRGLWSPFLPQHETLSNFQHTRNAVLGVSSTSAAKGCQSMSTATETPNQSLSVLFINLLVLSWLPRATSTLVTSVQFDEK